MEYNNENARILTISSYFKNKKILIWGTGDVGQRIFILFKKYKIDIYGFLDSANEKQTLFSKSIFSPDILKHNKNIYYVLIEVNNHFYELVNILHSYQYNHLLNYQYFYKPISVQKSYDYIDSMGNKIYGSVENNQVKFFGYNNTLIIRDDAKINNAEFIFLYNNSTIEIQEKSNIAGVIKITDNSHIIIGQKSYLHSTSTITAENNSKIILGNSFISDRNCELKASDHSILEIGNNASIQKDFFALVKYNSLISIGNSIKTSLYVSIICNDGHPIFDITTQKRLNNKPKKIYIGHHVWIGIKSAILSGALIANGCIIGANTVITKKTFPNNCIIAGNPAIILKKNTIWEHSQTNPDLIDDKSHWQETNSNS